MTSLNGVYRYYVSLPDAFVDTALSGKKVPDGDAYVSLSGLQCYKLLRLCVKRVHLFPSEHLAQGNKRQSDQRIRIAAL